MVYYCSGLHNCYNKTKIVLSESNLNCVAVLTSAVRIFEISNQIK